MNVSIEDDIPLEDTEIFFGNLATTDSGVTLNPDVAEVEIIDRGKKILPLACWFVIVNPEQSILLKFF